MKEVLENIELVIIIAGSLLAGFLYLLNSRKTSIQKAYSLLPSEDWTNEGDINGREECFVDLRLTLEKGELYGTLKSSKTERQFEVHAYPEWFRIKLVITELIGRNLIPIATIKIKIHGNDNRLKWVISEIHESEILPKETVLWPL